MSKIIEQFMWAWQEHFRLRFESKSEDVFKHFGIDNLDSLDFLLIGYSFDKSLKHQICIEPENSKWKQNFFKDLPLLVEECINNHHLKDIFYSDTYSNQQKPEWIRQSSVSQAIKEMFEALYPEYRIMVSNAELIDNYYVVSILKYPSMWHDRLLQVKYTSQFPEYQDDTKTIDILDCSLQILFQEIEEEAQYKLEAGHNILKGDITVEEIIEKSGVKFLNIIIQQYFGDFYIYNSFEHFSVLSSLMYEGTFNNTKLFICNNLDVIEFLVKFDEPVRISNYTWIRKIIQMGSQDDCIIADYQYVYGIAKNPSPEVTLIIDFFDFYCWRLLMNNQEVLVVKYGKAILEKNVIDKDRFIDNFTRVLKNASIQDAESAWDIYLSQIQLPHGSMTVFLNDAISESNRLSKQGTKIVPSTMSKQLLIASTKIDGSILMDEHCKCFAIGTILDGIANDNCKSSRGSRYNSAIRYVSDNEQRLAIVVSDDKSVEIIPLLPVKISKERIEKKIADLENSTIDNFYESRNWLNKHRLYLSDSNCKRINNAWDRIYQEIQDKDPMRLIIQYNEFEELSNYSEELLK